MKNIFKLAALALVAMSLTVACKSNTTEAPAEDTTPIEEFVADTVDSIEEVAEEVAAEEPVKKATAQVKKEEAKSDPTQVKDKELGSTLPAATSNKKVANGVNAEEKNLNNELPTTTGAKKVKK